MLFVPELSYNLCSVSQAVLSDKEVTFNKNGCTVREENGKIIATAKQKGNLFYLNHVDDDDMQQTANTATLKKTVQFNLTVSETEKETQKENQKETQIETQKENQKETQKENQKGNQKETQKENQKENQKETQKENQDEKQKENQKDASSSKLDIEPRIALMTHEQKWHSRYGHLGVQSLKRLAQEKMVTGLKDFNPSKDQELCKPCIDGKIHRQKFPKDGGTRAEEVLELVHTDVCGKLDTESLSGAQYFITFIDDKSRYTTAYVLKFKSQALEKFKEWKTMVEKMSGKPLKSVRSDNGGEYISKEFELYLKQNGISHQTTVKKTPEQNGVAERMNRTLIEAVRSLLSESNLHKRFWAEALMTSIYLRNRSPTSAVSGMTPYEVWTGRKPCVDNLRIFGCICYSHIPKDERKKLDPKAKQAIHMGYGTETKGYRLFDPKTKKVFYSRDVIFDESRFTQSPTKQTELQIIPEESEEDIPEPVKDMQHRSEARPQNQPNNIPEPEEDMQHRAGSRPRNPPNHYGEWVFSVESEESEPKTVKQALSSSHADDWSNAMSNEVNSLKKNNVWTLVELPAGRKAIGSKWIFKQKRDADGNVERYKARLVAQGYNQTYGVDYDETFSPVVRFESIRTIIGMAAKQGLALEQMDVKTAFLNGELQETIYMKQPEGFIEPGKENLVCLLHRSIYGLKQSARCWNFELDKQMKKMGFKQSETDPCIYVQVMKDGTFIIAIYVDDIILGGLSNAVMKKMKASLSEKFDVEDMGRLHHFLGVKIIQNPQNNEIWIGQSAYSKDLLRRFRMNESKPVDTPFDSSSKLKKAQEGEQKCDQQQYQSAVGSLLYLSTKTRPDIAYAVGVVCRYSSNPTSTHWTAVKRIMRYLQGTLNLGLLYTDDADRQCIGYSDADWAGDTDDRKSTTGYVFMLSGAAISWKSKKQTVVALSTAEAEYMALTSTIQEAMWMRNLLTDLQEDISKPTTIFEDNQSAICMAKNRQCKGQSKHIDIKYHFVREKISEGRVEIEHCETANMLADTFTKGLPRPKFQKMRELIGMVDSLHV